MKKTLRIVALIICIVAISVIAKHYISSTNISNNQELIDYICQKENLRQIKIIETKTKDEFLVVYYVNNDENHLIILEKDTLFSNRYNYFGGSYNSSDFDTFNFGQSSSWALIVVYGNNSGLRAASYEFVNNKKTYTNQNLGDYVLDIYIIENTSDISSYGYLYDENGEILCTL